MREIVGHDKTGFNICHAIAVDPDFTRWHFSSKKRAGSIVRCDRINLINYLADLIGAGDIRSISADGTRRSIDDCHNIWWGNDYVPVHVWLPQLVTTPVYWNQVDV